MKKLLSLLLAVCMVFSVTAVAATTACAVETFTPGMSSAVGDDEAEPVFIVAGSSAEIFGMEWAGSYMNNLMSKGPGGNYEKVYTIDKA